MYVKMSKVKFKNGRVGDYTIVLSTRDKRHLGQLYGLKGVTYSGNMNGANEMSFTVYKSDLVRTNDKVYNKKIEKHREYLWNNIVDFKLIWVKELNEYFEIKISLDDSNDVYKSITATSLCEAELSQVMLYNIEINSLESDVLNEDYKRTTFYNDEDHKASLLHRILECVPHYKIAHVDNSLCDIQRTFSIDGTSVYDFLVGECAEQFDCLFIFNSAKRSISVYDLLTVCNKCGERGDFYDECTNCGSKELKYYGKDTTIYVDKNNLTDSIQLSTNADNIKNCFKLEAGDENITLTARGLNQNGSDRIYIDYSSDLNKKCNDCGMYGEFVDKCSNCGSTNWDYTNERIKDMPKELVEKLIDYTNLYNSYTDEFEQLLLDSYNLSDKIAYYTSSMMPKVQHLSNVDYATEEDLNDIEDPKEGIIYVWNETVYLYDGENFVPQYEDNLFYMSFIESFVDAETEASKLTEMNLSPIGLASITPSTSLATVNNAIKNYAKIYVKTGYVKLDVAKKSDGDYDAEFILETEENEDGKKEVIKDDDGWHYGIWRGKLQVTNYSNEEDVAYTGYLTIKVYDNYQEFETQRIEKNLKSNDDDNGSVYDALSINEIEDFKKVIKLYSYNRLDSFYQALDGVVTLLQEMGHHEDGADLYDLYLSYQDKKRAIISKKDSEDNIEGVELGELEVREIKINELTSEQNEVQTRMSEIQSELNFEDYLGELYPIFCAYKREDKYSNSNYTSDGLNNAEIIDKAKEFIEVAKKELIKSSEQQYTLSATLYNLLVMNEFKDIVNYFELGNWIRVRVDGILYRLRLIGYTINFDSMQTIDVEFSTLTKVKDIMSDVESILSSAQSMATSYGSVSKQSERGQEANNSLNSIVQNGLNSGLVQIKNNNNEEVIYGKNGIILRQYDDITESYDGKQCRLTHNAMLYTTDGWETASLAIGEHDYTYYDTDANQMETSTDYGLTAKFVTAGHIYGTQMIAGNIYSENYKEGGEGSHFNLYNGNFNLGNKFVWDGTNLNVDGNGQFSGKITAESGYIGSDDYDYKWTIGNDETRAYIYNGTDSMTSIIDGTYLGTDGFRNYQSSSAYVNISNGVLDCNGAKIKGAITGGTISIGSNFSVDEYGNVIATNATLKGNINASNANITGNIYANYLEANTGGKIGGWTIGTATLKGGNVTLNSNGDITGVNWSITNGGKASFNNVSVTGGSMSWGNFGVTTGGVLTVTNANIKGDSSVAGSITASKFKFDDGQGHFASMGHVTKHTILSGLNLSVTGGLNFRKNASSSSDGDGVASINSSTSGGLTYGSGSGNHVFSGGNVNIKNDLDLDGLLILPQGQVYCGKRTSADNGGVSDVTLIAKGNSSLGNANYPDAYVRISENGNPTIRGMETYLRTNTLYIHDGDSYKYKGYTGTKTVGSTSLTFRNGLLVTVA